MGTIPVQQSPAARSRSYGSQPGVNASIGRPDVSAGRVQRGIYGQYEQFKPMQYAGPTPAQAAAPYMAVGEAVNNIGQTYVKIKQEQQRREQEFYDTSALNSAKTNTSAYLADANAELRQMVKSDLFTVEEYDEKFKQLNEGLSEAVYTDIDKDLLSEKSQFNIEESIKLSSSQFLIEGGKVRSDFITERAKRNNKKAITSAIKNMQEDKIKEIIDSGIGFIYNKDEAEEEKKKALAAMDVHKLRTSVLYNHPIAAEKLIYDKNAEGISKHMPNGTLESQALIERELKVALQYQRKSVFEKASQLANNGMLNKAWIQKQVKLGNVSNSDATDMYKAAAAIEKQEKTGLRQDSQVVYDQAYEVLRKYKANQASESDLAKEQLLINSHFKNTGIKTFFNDQVIDALNPEKFNDKSFDDILNRIEEMYSAEAGGMGFDLSKISGARGEDIYNNVEDFYKANDEKAGLMEHMRNYRNQHPNQSYEFYLKELRSKTETGTKRSSVNVFDKKVEPVTNTEDITFESLQEKLNKFSR